jgi:hypothetical protein
MQTHAALLLATFALALFAGCSQRAEPIAQMAPTIDELPEFPQFERHMSARVGVEEYSEEPLLRMVPPEPELAITPEEKDVLAEQEKDRELTLLSLYEPERGAEQGILPTEKGGLVTGSNGLGGSQPGLAPAKHPVGRNAHTRAGVQTGIAGPSRVGAQSGARQGAGVGRKGNVLVGENPPRQPAGRHRSVDP